MTLLQPSSSAAATALTAINSMGTTRASVNAQETDIKKKGKQLHLDGIKQDQTAAELANSAPSSIVKKQSTAAMKPDIGILSKDFLKNKGQGEQPVDKQFAVHQKKLAAGDVDVGILSNKRQHGGYWLQQHQTTPGANLHAENGVTGRSLQSGWLPNMCPGKYGYAEVEGGLYYRGPGLIYLYGGPGVIYGGLYYTITNNLSNQMDIINNYFFSKCSCPSPTTCGPNLCECLEYADGDIFQCMDSFNKLCQFTKYIEGIPGPWSMEECLGDKIGAIYYCSILPCFVEGGSIWQCLCNVADSLCAEIRDKRPCARSKCCQAQTDDEGREACFNQDILENYYDEDTSFSISDEEMISRFNECSFNSDSGKSVVQCYCESFSYKRCVNDGRTFPHYCEAMNCCFEQTEDDARLDCFTNRYLRDVYTGEEFNYHRDTIQDSCIASGKSSDQCKCDIHGLSNCVRWVERRCDLLECCQSQTDDEGRKDCLVQDEVQQRYIQCINDDNTTESCACEKSNMLCSSGHSNDLHCELSNCCREQSDDTGREECIGSFTTQVLEDSAMGTPNSSNSSLLGPKKLRKALVAAVIGLILLT